MNKILLETERLDIRRVKLSDLDEMARINGDHDVMRYFGDSSLRTLPQNEPSKRVLMKAGLQLRGMRNYYERQLCYFVAEV